MARSVEIVGAGLAGLTAGITLARQGISVKIYESRTSMLGGHSWADSTLLNPVSLQRDLGITVDEALSPWDVTRAWAYGKRYEFPNPSGSTGYVVERGGGETSLENVLYGQALEAGVEVALGKRLTKDDLREMSPGTIIATGLERESFELTDLPCRPFFCHHATGTPKPDRPAVIIYLDRFTREFGYYCQTRHTASSLVFSVQRPLTDGEKEGFKTKLAANDGVTMENWDDHLAAWAAWPIGSWRNRQIERGGKILAGTLSGAVSPVLLFGVNGALASGRIAADLILDRGRARRELKRLAPLYYPQFLLRKAREYLPHPVLRTINRSILNTYDPDHFPWLMQFILTPPGYHGGR